MPKVEVNSIEGELAVICTLLTTKVSNSIELLLQENLGLLTALEETREELKRIKEICKEHNLTTDPETPPEAPISTENK